MLIRVRRRNDHGAGLVIVLVVSCLLVTTGLTPIVSGSAAPSSAQTFTFAIDGDAQTLDPHTTADATSDIFKLNVYEGLVRFKPGTTQIEPALVTDWHASADGLTWTFHLRKGVKFHDGTDFNAQAVEFSVARMKMLNQGMAVAALHDVAAVSRVLDSYTVAFQLSTVDVTFLDGLTGVMMVSPAAFGPNMSDGGAVKWAFNHEAGTGPFTLASWQPTRRMELAEFPGYWGGWDHPHVQRIVQLVVQDSNTRRLMLQRGDVDLILRLEDESDDAHALQKAPGIVVQGFPTLTVTYIMMDTAKGPLRDVRVRRAISLAVNYATLQQIAYGGLAKQARGPLSSAIPFFDKTLPTPQRDIDKAKQMLGGTALATGGTLTLGYVGTVDTQQRIVQIVQANLADLGISVTTRPSTYPVLLESFQNPDQTPDFVLLNNNSAYPDPDWTFSSFFVSAARGKGGTNAAWYSNPEVDQLTTEGRVALDSAKRAAIYGRLQRIIVGDAPAIWNAETVFIMAYRNYVKGLEYVSAHTRSLGYLDHVSVQGKP